MKKISIILLHGMALGTIGGLHYYYNCSSKCKPKIKYESNDSY